MKQKIVIFANGIVKKQFLNDLTGHELVVGVDGAAYWLIKHGVKPHLAIGDFDSTTKEELDEVKKIVRHVLVYPTEKNYTDTELALQAALRRNPGEVVIYGIMGTRFDHTLGALHTLEQPLRAHIPVCLRDATNEISLLDSRRTIKKDQKYRYVSVIPYTKTATVTLSGFHYPLVKTIMRQGTTLGISNELKEQKGTIIVHKGTAVVIRSRD